jgi:S-adenosylmethionine:tRNA ribosyltransferase-isomerase
MDRLSDYDFDLPPELIAQEPLADRAASRLLAVDRRSGERRHLHFTDAPKLLRKGDLLVVNRTRVTALRLLGQRLRSDGEPNTTTHSNAELLLLRRESPGVYEALTRPAKRLKPGTRLVFGDPPALFATVLEARDEGLRIVSIEPEEAIERHAIAPLPPYIKRPLANRERYQTIYAKASDQGSAAAPTAGLHFTPEILQSIRQRGVEIAEVELAIGLDTFRPIQSETLDAHQMHGERCLLPPETAEKIAGTKGRIVAVGTTTARTLETFARLGDDPKRPPPGATESRLFLHPRNRPILVDALFTNFHMPRTSMLVMLSAFADRELILDAYAEARVQSYRWLSFGDCMFLGELPDQFET